jgi:hypothetical protein
MRLQCDPVDDELVRKIPPVTADGIDVCSNVSRIGLKKISIGSNRIICVADVRTIQSQQNLVELVFGGCRILSIEKLPTLLLADRGRPVSPFAGLHENFQIKIVFPQQ